MLPAVMVLFLTVSHNRVHAQHQEQALIKKLNHFYGFDHNIILLESTGMFNRFVNATSDVPQTLLTFEDRPGESDTQSIGKSSSPFMAIGLKNVNIERQLVLMTKVKEFQRGNVNLKIGLFVREMVPDTRGYALELFEWCWRHSIVSIFLAYPRSQRTVDDSFANDSLEVVTFNPYGQLELIYLTDDQECIGEFFPKICYNLRQHTIRTMVFKDLSMFNLPNGSIRFGGPDGKLWLTIFSVVNATHNLVKLLQVMIGVEISNAVRDGEVDVGPQAFLVSNDQPNYLYPVYLDRVVVVVPVAKPYAEFTGYLMTFFGEISFDVALVTMPVVIVVLTVIRYCKRKGIFFFQSAADVFNLFMYDNMSINYRSLNRVEAFIILPLTLAGFIIVNILLSVLTSYLTQPMSQPELDTFSDIERSPFPVMVPSKYQIPHLIQTVKQDWGVDWSHKLIATDTTDKFFKEILSFNTSVCFIYFGTKARNLLIHQKRLHIRGYRVPADTISRTAFGYVVRHDYPLKECFNEIIHAITSAGLYWKWRDDSYFEFVKQGFFRNAIDDDGGRVDEVSAPTFILYGWMGSVMVFIMEIAWHRIKIKYNAKYY